MATVGDLVFRRGQSDNDSDIWDDTALIKAYDKSVSMMKARLAEATGVPADGATLQADDAERKKHKKNKKRHKRKEKITLEPKWKVGDMCQAVFTDDGQLYPAVIRSTATEEGTCIVEYLEYGNQEEQELSSLLPAAETSTARPASGPQSENESMDWNQASYSPLHAAPHRSARRARAGLARGNPPASGTAAGGWGWPPPPPAPAASFAYPAGMPQGVATPPLPPLMQPMVPPFNAPSFNGWATGAPPIPMMPPPPPVDGDALESDKEALYSMLISWYMSGYHTGYYQGLKQGKKASDGSDKMKDSSASAATLAGASTSATAAATAAAAAMASSAAETVSNKDAGESQR